jgi:hypothetical protein
METLTNAFPRVGSPLRQSTTIPTTLYDLVNAIAAEVRPDERALVTAITVHILRSHKAKFIEKRMRRQVWCKTLNYLNSVSA